MHSPRKVVTLADTSLRCLTGYRPFTLDCSINFVDNKAERLSVTKSLSAGLSLRE